MSELEPGERHEDRDLTAKENNRMIFTGENILSGFKKRLEGATRIHIATAWATPGLHLDALGTAVQGNELKVRAIVGTHSNATDPVALEHLKNLGKLRLAKEPPLFHSKVYIFESENGASRAWVGSANFTQAGFGNRNVETMYETKDVKPFLEEFKQQWSQLEPATGKEINEYKERRRRNPPKRDIEKLVGESEGATPGPSLPPEAQTWEAVLDPREIRRAFERMRTTLTDRPGVEELMRNGRMVHWRTDLRYWCAFSQRDHGYWNAFGPGNPWESDRFGNGCLQINPPFDGTSEHAGRYHGLFVRNDSGDIFLARDLKGIRRGRGVVDPEDLEEGLEERLPGRIVDVPWDERWIRRMVVLGEVGSGELRHAVAELVGLVVELKGAAGEAS